MSGGDLKFRVAFCPLGDCVSVLFQRVDSSRCQGQPWRRQDSVTAYASGDLWHCDLCFKESLSCIRLWNDRYSATKTCHIECFGCRH